MSSDERIAQLETEISELKAQNRELRGATQQRAEPRRRRIGWRKIFGYLCLVLGVAALVPAGMLLWLDRTLMRPESYIASVGPVINQPAVQQAISKSATDALFDRVDVNGIVSQALPEQAQFLAAPIATEVKSYTVATVGTIVASPEFATIWVRANVKAQAAFMKVAQEGSGNATVNLNEVFQYISGALAGTSLAGLANKQLPPNVGNIPVATVPALERIPHLVAVLDTWRWVLVGLVVALLALAVWLIPNRRQALVWMGWGVIVAELVTLIVVRITRAVMLDSIPDAVYREAAVAVWQTVLNPFLVQILVTSILGLAIVLTGWLLGPGRVAVGLRRHVQGWLVSTRTAVFPAAEHSAMVRFVRRHHRSLQWGLLALTVALLAVLVPLTVGVVLAILGGAVVLLILLEMFNVAARPE